MSDTTKRKHRGRLIDTSVRIETTPDRAWSAWADPQQIANWFVDRAEGVAAPGETMTWFFDTFNYRQVVPIVEAQPGKTFVIGSGDQAGPQGLPYLMEILIERDGGATVVRLLNSGFSPDAKFDDEFEGVVSGWQMALTTLKYWLEHHDGTRRVHTLVIEPAEYDWASLMRLFMTSEGRRKWIDPLLPADTSELTTTKRETLLAWPQREAVIGLKAFRMGSQPVLALDVSSWPSDPNGTPDLTDELRAALVRLKSALG
jgi:uncharacterized protein YndB with AHSA1/START domain